MITKIKNPPITLLGQVGQPRRKLSMAILKKGPIEEYP
jgi:hypothetical protein